LICESESAKLISSVFKENMSEVELQIINLQTDLSLKTTMNDTDFWNLVLSAVFYSETNVFKVNACFNSAYLSD
jgi:hypothetical protein